MPDIDLTDDERAVLSGDAEWAAGREHPVQDSLHGNPTLRTHYQRARTAGKDYAAAIEYARRQQQAAAADDETHSTSEVNKSLVKSYVAVDDQLLDAIQRSVWWRAEADPADLDLEKSPRIWYTGQQVPDAVQNLLADVIDSHHWEWADFQSLTIDQAEEVKRIIRQHLTDPGGWSLGSLSQEIERAVDVPHNAAVGLTRDTTHSVLNVAREEAYERMEGAEAFEYTWLNPLDHRTTDVCRDIIAEVDERGGSVTLPTLKQILRTTAQEYEDTREGGTPERVDNWTPHYNCRSTFGRVVKTF